VLFSTRLLKKRGTRIRTANATTPWSRPRCAIRCRWKVRVWCASVDIFRIFEI